MIKEELNKDNLHHAYLIDGVGSEIVPEILAVFEDMGVKTVGNADFCQIALDTLKIEDARNLKSLGSEKSFSTKGSKKVFIISANSILLEAQNALLKLFEEPIENTHFFVIVPDTNALLATFISRFYKISPRQDLGKGLAEAQDFIAMNLPSRINFIKELLTEEEGEDEEGNEILVLNSTRSKALKFLNQLETCLHSKMSRSNLDMDASFFEQIFKVREFLRQPGSSAKSLMESVALVVPVL